MDIDKGRGRASLERVSCGAHEEMGPGEYGKRDRVELGTTLWPSFAQSS